MTRIEQIAFVDGIKKTKREHPGYSEYMKTKAIAPYLKLPSTFGQWQYLYESQKGIVDAVLLTNYFRDGKDFWEIYSDEKLFTDVERFETLEEAEERIKEILL